MTQPTQTKQWLTNQDGLDKLYQALQASIPQPGHKEVLVKIHTVSLNYRDTEVIRGDYGHHKSVEQNKSLVPCSDMCGTVVKAGPGASLKEGQRVVSTFLQTFLTGTVKESDMASGLGLPLDGALQEYRVFSESALVNCPDYMTDEEASTLPIAAVTAFMAINWMQPMGSLITNPETIVLFQGTGGVSISGLQIAKACGLKGKLLVIIIPSS
jgi:NADPH:quinone reductase-like Zn-dependent oxidoreductase